MFDECVEFGKENGAFDPNRGLLSKCRLDDAEGTKKRVFELMAWPSREGWLCVESICPRRMELKGTDERVLALRTVCCRVQDERSRFRGRRTRRTCH